MFVKGLSEAIKRGDILNGDMLSVDMNTGAIQNLTRSAQFHGDAVGDLEHDIMKMGGLFQYMKAKAKEER